MFQLRSMLAAGQRQAQRVEQRLALAAGARPSAPRSRRRSRPRRRDPAGSSSAAAASSSRLGHDRPQRPAAHLPPLARILEPAEVAADRLPERGVDPAQAQLAQARRHLREEQVVQHGGARSAAGRRPSAWAPPGRRPPARSRRRSSSSSPRRDRRPAAVPSAARRAHDRQGLDALLAQRAQAQGTQPLGEIAGPPHRRSAADGRTAAPALPAPARIASCSAVLLTWSSPRMTWLMPSSASSTAEANR